MKHYGLWINGNWVDTENTMAVTNPATGEVIATVAEGGIQQAQDAIDAASRAFRAWSAMPAPDRARILRNVADRIRARAQGLAEILTTEQGKPLREAKAEILMSADYFEWNSEEAKRIYGETIPASVPNKRLWAIRQPVGVVAAITPWNFPASMIARKVSPALAAGCTVVIKPAETTPLSALEMGQIFEQAGMPSGVVNIIAGPPEPIAEAFLTNPAVRKLSFTGSTEVGQLLMRRAAQDLKKLSLELGGHAPFIVMDDADLELAVAGVVASKFRNAGQTCICANRLYVQHAIYEEFSQRLARRVRDLKVGTGFDPSVDIGPMIDNSAVEKVERQVRDAVARGGRVITGGQRVVIPNAGSGWFYAPTLVADITHDALVAQEETFGPLLGLWEYQTDEEVMQWANDTPYGLAAYFYGRDLGRVVRMYESLQYGIIGVNDPVPTVVQAPFGGVKHSGFGREGGHQGLDDYLEWKFVSIGL
ncbi:MAG: NAD-dependent succinate-semialdehyde dehydrogenase [Thermaerobacter sp.]|nr:NAD-dependent succinate-semialdehyde dehydrogenase [Thermaerobacter sp.]